MYMHTLHTHTYTHTSTYKLTRAHTGTNVFTVKVYDVEKNESSKTRNPGPH